MAGGICYKPSAERGAWFELKCLRDTISGKEAGGLSAEFERKLYKSWLKYPEYAKADRENQDSNLYGDSTRSRDTHRGVSKIKSDISDVILPPANLSTVNGSKNKVDKLTPRLLKDKPGPKTIELPKDLIKSLVIQGMGSKAIASELADKGIKVSYKTIQRRVSRNINIAADGRW